ncbi:MAG TPA: hypothetical protein VJR92_00570 [Gemmatimonadaceae bacterium]|nr:hypothetical protein [Gemmatimonadaceae bacterium]
MRLQHRSVTAFAVFLTLTFGAPRGARAQTGTGGAASTGRGSAAAAGQSRPDTTWSSTRADRAMRLRADSLRNLVLSYSAWVGFAQGPCATGDVRTFDRDSTGVVQRALGNLEFLVLTYGAYTSLNNVTGRALMRAVVRLETLGGPAPRWDVASGRPPRALNPVLPASLYNPESKRCVPVPGATPDGLVLPEMTNFTPPRDSGAVDFAVSYGPGGLNRLRDFFATKQRAGDSVRVFRNTRVIAHAVWQDYAIVAVQRDAERLGAIPLPQESTGATYAWRRVGAEWRLLAVVRTW